jgi:hypothetical protein
VRKTVSLAISRDGSSGGMIRTLTVRFPRLARVAFFITVVALQTQTKGTSP